MARTLKERYKQPKAKIELHGKVDPELVGRPLGFVQAEILNEADKFQKSIQVLNRLLKIHPTNSKAFALKADNLWNLYKNKESIIECKKAIKFDPRNPDAWHILALVHTIDRSFK